MTETPPQQAYISKVHLKGYKSIRDLEIDFKPGLNIIIGPNGSGKTNFLEFLHSSFNFFEIIDNNEFDVKIFFKKDNKPYKQNLKGRFKNLPNSDIYFESTEEIYQDELLYKLKIEFYKSSFNRRHLIVGKEETAKFDFIPFPLLLEFKNVLSNIFDEEREGRIKIIENNENNSIVGLNKLGKTVCLPLIQSEISKNSSKDFFSKTNDNFNAQLNKCTLIQEVGFDVSRIISYVDENNDTIIENIIPKFLIKNKWFYWNQLSDGTKRMFYLMLYIYFHSRNIILLEEPELGIHPDQLHKLMDFLIEQSKEKQIIITTHSPEVLNAIHPDELDRIIVTRYDADKGTIMHKLTPEQAKEMGARVKEGDMFLSDRWVHLNLEDEIFNATKLNEK